MATILLTLRSRKRQDSTQPVVIRIRHENRYFDISTGVHLTKESFQQLIAGSFENYQTFEFLEELKSKYLKRLRRFQSETVGRKFSFIELKSFILLKDPNEVFVREFWEESIDMLLKSNRGGSAKIYKNTLSVLSKIINLECPFSKISLKDLQTIEKLLRVRGNNYNSIGVYMRTFRAICNAAINHGYADLEWYPFRKYKIKKEKTVPRVLSLEEMRKYFSADITPENPLYKAWCIGKLLFMLRGINLRDLIFLTDENLKGNRIIYKRGKTGKMYSIKIQPEIQKSLDVFSNKRRTLLGVILDDYLENENKSLHYRSQINKRINEKLKRIGVQLNFNEKLTTYVFRYSYANIARKLGFSKDLIAEALGHDYGNSVTGIYLELFDQDVLDKMNKNIIENITLMNSGG